MIVSLLVVAFRFANALLITTTFAPDEYYQAMEPAYHLLLKFSGALK